MGLIDTYRGIKESIVAFVPRVFPSIDDKGGPLPFPPIIGTGFVIRDDGLIATNNHVVASFKGLTLPPGASEDDWPVVAILLKPSDMGIIEVPLTLCGAAVIKSFQPAGVYYGPPKPDIALVRVRVRGLAPVTLDGETVLEEGMEVATAGFPMGRDALMAPGWMHQITPTLQRGIISAVMPFATSHPHAIAVNVMAHGGASGSPVFLPDTGKVVGILYGGLVDVKLTKSGEEIKVPSTISHAVPGHIVASALNDFAQQEGTELPSNTRTLDELISSANLVSRLDDGIEKSYMPAPIDGAIDNAGIQLTVRRDEE